jgi:uncharacterized protein (TIGR03083 family)
MASPAPRAIADDAVLTMAVDVGMDGALRHISALGERFAALVESIEAPHALARGLQWTVAETSVHVLVSFSYYASCLRGETTFAAERAPGETLPAFVARQNRKHIDAEPERDPAKLAQRLRASIEEFVALARAVGPGANVTFAAGYTEESTTSVCTLIGELVVHGYDIARTTGASWDVDPAAAVLAVYSTSAALSLAIDPVAAAGKDINVEIRARGGTPFSIRVRDGRAWSELPAATPDAHVSTDALAYLLVGYGRVPIAGPLLRGRILAWGRRPWVLLQLPKMFLSP